MHTNTSTITDLTGDRLLADLNPDAPAKVRMPAERMARFITPDDTVMRIPDYFEDGMAVFIGEDATVMVEKGALPDLSLRLVRGSIGARTGHFPAEQGIVVHPHNGVLTDPAYGSKHHEAQVAWAHVHHALTIPA